MRNAAGSCGKIMMEVFDAAEVSAKLPSYSRTICPANNALVSLGMELVFSSPVFQIQTEEVKVSAMFQAIRGVGPFVEVDSKAVTP
jgi:hypothetical protein